MGFYNALQACFSLHQLNHAHWAEVNENGQALGSPEHGVPSWKDAPPIRAAVRDSV
jgi:enoyl-CoA hydratase